jgi:predicted ATPase/GAF domain-containing protein
MSHALKRDALFQLQRVATAEGGRFLVKFAVSELGGGEDTLLRNEFSVFQQLDSEHVLRPVRLEGESGKLAAYYEDLDGTPLSLGEPFRAADLSALAVVVSDLCSALTAFHRSGLIVGGLCPSSFLSDRDGKRVVLADAPFARPIAQPSDRGKGYWLRSPYLAYAAPEIIGRVPLEADGRADLYSLGGVLYELLSSRAPFETADPSELVQCHLAKQPRPLLELQPAVPAPVAAGVMRLLAKSPDDRFESADAFEEEMLRAIGRVARAGARSRRAPAVRAPPSGQLLSNRLYGMETVERSLREKLRRTRSMPALTFIEGDAGVGKTSLLGHARSLLEHGCFCRGRFVNVGPVAPLSGWSSALRELANAILTRTANDTEQWRTKIQKALGEGAALISLLVPEWAAILGPARHSSEQTADGGLNRLAIAIHALVRCFAEPDAPVVLVLDDLQWADSSSLHILELVLELPEPLNLLVLAGVRSPSEPAADAQLAAMRDRLGTTHVDFDRLHLGCWTHEDLRAFLGDSFGEKLSEADAFAELVLARTHGNPLFVHEFLKALIEQEMLAFEPSTASWSWQPAAIRALPPVDGLVAFLTRKILNLPDALKRTLCTAACLGAGFDLAEFAAVSRLSREAAAARLEAAVAEGLLLPRTDAQSAASPPSARETRYDFAHDRVLEACRSLMSEDERASHCLQIGRTLLSAYRESGVPALSHRLAEYYNTARALISSDEERLVSVELNLAAGTVAKQSGAFSQAFDYFQSGLAFLGSLAVGDAAAESHAIAWRQHFDLSRAMFEETAEAAMLNARFERAYELCSVILGHLAAPLDKVRTYEIRVRGYSAEKRFPEAVAAACEILSELGIAFPKNPGILHAALAYVSTRRKLLSGPLERLVGLVVNVDPRLKAASRIMHAMYSSAYFAQRNLFPLIVCRHIDESLRHGNEDYSCVTYIAFAIVLSAMGDFDNAMRLGTVALELLEHLRADRHKAKVFMGMYAFVFPWKHHLRDTIPHMSQAIDAALEHGDFEYACHLLMLRSFSRLHSGCSLVELAPEFDQHRIKIGTLGQERSIILQQLLCQLVHDLREPSADRPPLDGPEYAESGMLARCLEPLDHNLAFHNYMARMMLCLFLGDRASALEAARAARPFFEVGAFGIYLGAIFTFWESLLFLWAFRTSRRGRMGALRRASKGARLLRRWAENAPMNFLHKYHLVEAERCRARGRADAAALHYERAIELSQAHGYVQDTALAQELAAEFYLERGMERLGRNYLRECYMSYRRWGATAVTRRLERGYPQHFAVFVSQDRPDSAPLGPLFDDLDYRVLLKSSQVISGEVRLPNLLERLLRTMSEHAGAQRALMVLERRGQLYVEAEADVDRDSVELLHEEAADESGRLCRSVVRYVANTGAPVVLGDALRDDRFREDDYIADRRPKSVLCVPIAYQGRVIGVAYLENNRVSHVFTAARLEVATLLAGQAAISIASARFHALELEAQQARINPHFLFNALSSIAELAIQNGAKTEEAVLKLAHLYRYVLTASMEERVTLEQELDMVRRYLELEKLRFGSKLEFFISCEQEVTGVKIPGLLIQPLVENSIRHGVSPKMTTGRVSVHASQATGQCRIVVQDDGDGLKHNNTAGTSFGLRSVQERLALLYGQDYGMAITRRGGYRVELTLPLEGPPDVRTRSVFG